MYVFRIMTQPLMEGDCTTCLFLHTFLKKLANSPSRVDAGFIDHSARF